MGQKMLGADNTDETVINPDDIIGQFEDVTDLQNDIDSQMDAIFQEFGGDDRDTEFKIIVKRAIPGKGEVEHCFSATPAELPIIDRIKENFGAGTYQIWVYKNGKIFKRRVLNIAKELKKEAPVLPGNDTNSLVQMVMENNRQMAERMEAFMKSQQQTPTTDPMAMMTGMMSAMVQMKEFIGGGSNQMDTLLGAVKLIKEVGGGDSDGGSGRNFIDGIVELGGKVMPALAEMSKHTPPMTPPAGAPGQPQASVQNNPAPAQVENNTQQPTNEDIQMQQAAMKQQLQFLMAQAAANKSTALWADMVMDMIPENVIVQWISEPNEKILQYFAQFEPGIMQYQQWFTELLNEIRAAFSETDDGNTDGTIPANEGLTGSESGANTSNSSEPIQDTPNDAVSRDSDPTKTAHQ